MQRRRWLRLVKTSRQFLTGGSTRFWFGDIASQNLWSFRCTFQECVLVSSKVKLLLKAIGAGGVVAVKGEIFSIGKL